MIPHSIGKCLNVFAIDLSVFPPLKSNRSDFEPIAYEKDDGILDKK
jgi:hypothetical protein